MNNAKYRLLVESQSSLAQTDSNSSDNGELIFRNNFPPRNHAFAQA